jgi:glycine hydroxymethyltransferase
MPFEALASEHRPKIIIAGYSSYPWAVDWARFKAIAKSVGAYLLADIAHVAGLVAAGVYPTPVGHADIITFTTHKSLCGPRGACILTRDAALARKIDRAVFPGEQGGPHMHAVAGMAVAFKLARSEPSASTSSQVVQTARPLPTDWRARLPHPLRRHGHPPDEPGLPQRQRPGRHALSGDQAARILDLAGIVVNRNTIPGDKSAANPAGIRMGTPWITQRGFKEADMVPAGRYHRRPAAVRHSVCPGRAQEPVAARQGRFQYPGSGQAARASAGREGRHRLRAHALALPALCLYR